MFNDVDKTVERVARVDTRNQMHSNFKFLSIQERRRKAGQIHELVELWESNRRALQEEKAEERKNAKVSMSKVGQYNL